MNAEQTLAEITDRRLETRRLAGDRAKAINDLANERAYVSALIQADALIADAKRLRSRVEMEKLAYERCREAEGERQGGTNDPS